MIRVAAVIVATACVLVACSNNSSNSPERQTAKDATTHFETLGIQLKSSRCKKQSIAYTCTLRTKQDIAITVTVTTDRHNKTIYTTTAGLIDGRATQRRLRQQLTLRAHKPVTVTCPPTVPANTGGTFACAVWPTNTPQQRHTITVKVLNDHTGDFTYSIT